MSARFDSYAVPSDAALKHRIEELEHLSQIRERERVAFGIRWMLAKAPATTYLHLRMLNWCWRSGLHELGLQLSLTAPESRIRCESERDIARLSDEHILWGAYFAFSGGAWSYSSRLLEMARPRSQRARILRGMTLFGSGRYGDSLEVLGSAAASVSLERRWQLISTIAQAYLELGRPFEAIPWIERGLEVFRFDPDRWVLECMRARAVFETGKKAQGLHFFESADRRTSGIALQAPRWFGFTRNWKGVMLAQAGQSALALKCFREALVHHRQEMLDYQPGRILLTYDHMARVGLLEGPERREFSSYPVKHPRCTGQNVVAWLPRSPEWEFFLGPDEYFHEEKCLHTIPLELRLGAVLAQAGSLGMTNALVKSWLWPDSLGSYFSLDLRLNQVVRRLRKCHGFEIERDRAALWLAGGSRSRVGVDPDLHGIPRFLRKLTRNGAAEFRPSEVAASYLQSTAMVTRIIRHWMDRGWVERIGHGRGTLYRVRASARSGVPASNEGVRSGPE